MGRMTWSQVAISGCETAYRLTRNPWKTVCSVASSPQQHCCGPGCRGSSPLGHPHRKLHRPAALSLGSLEAGPPEALSGANAVIGLRWEARWAAVTATAGWGKSVLAGRTALRSTSAAQQAGRHRARISHAGHRRIDTAPLPHRGSSFRHIVGVNGSFEDVSDFVNDQQWVEVAPNADSVRVASSRSTQVVARRSAGS